MRFTTHYFSQYPPHILLCIRRGTLRTRHPRESKEEHSPPGEACSDPQSRWPRCREGFLSWGRNSWNSHKLSKPQCPLGQKEYTELCSLCSAYISNTYTTNPQDVILLNEPQSAGRHCKVDLSAFWDLIPRGTINMLEKGYSSLKHKPLIECGLWP